MVDDDYDALLNARLPFAQQMLAKHDAFFPFGGYIESGGKVGHTSGWTGDEQPTPQELIDLMVRGLRSQAGRGEIRASAVCVDVRTVPPGQTQKTDAILVSMEHSEGEPVDAYLPYRKTTEGQYEYGELFLVRGQPRIFDGTGSAG
jgi:hypothetical protein